MCKICEDYKKTIEKYWNRNYYYSVEDIHKIVNKKEMEKEKNASIIDKWLDEGGLLNFDFPGGLIKGTPEELYYSAINHRIDIAERLLNLRDIQEQPLYSVDWIKKNILRLE